MYKKAFLFFVFVLACASLVYPAEPRLVVVISLDQFRSDYITRWRQYFGKGGFNYLLQSGATFTNAAYTHAVNTTGPGHAAMLSASYGNVNGIIANDWYDRSLNKSVYCVEDRGVAIVGSGGAGRSPRNFLGSTFGDELRLKTGFRAKVLSLSNKDRAAILMGGKLANGAFWMMDSVFVTSTYYMSELPAWVQAFNRSRVLDSFFGETWSRKLPASAYAGEDVDDASYEKDENGLGRTFPHKIRGNDSTRITPSYYGAMWSSPFSAKALCELAKHAVRNEQLGRREVTDLLCLSFSATDGVGHAFGPNSHEVMDLALRMDEILADLFSFLDSSVGLKNCVIVLTADHGVAPIPEYLLAHNTNMNAGRIRVKEIESFCSAVLTKRFGEPKQGMKWIHAIVGSSIYLNRPLFDQMNFPTLEWAAKELADSLRTLPPIAAAYSSREMLTMPGSDPLERKMKRSFYRLRSGDVMFALKPFWLESDSPFGTTHGSPYAYDAHVPLIFAGNGIRKGTYANDASPIDIAPTLCTLLGIEFPAGSEGRVLTEALLFP